MAYQVKVYKLLSEDATIMHYKYAKWTQDLGQTIAPDIYQFGKLHKQIFSITNIPKYRSFQYRLLQRGLITNIQLQQWGIKPSPNCTFCRISPETIQHLLSECQIVQEIWQKVANLLRQKYGYSDIKLDTISIIQNSIVPGTNNVGNFICLITKQYIYRKKCQNQTLIFTELSNHIAGIRAIE